MNYTICKYDKMICLLEAHMVNTLKLPVGIDSFEKIRRNGFYYIDKTNLIEQIILSYLHIV